MQRAMGGPCLLFRAAACELPRSSGRSIDLIVISKREPFLDFDTKFEWHRLAKASTTAFYQSKSISIKMASTNFRHSNNVQHGLDFSAAAISYFAGLCANQARLQVRALRSLRRREEDYRVGRER
jgi:hypothetical protein